MWFDIFTDPASYENTSYYNKYSKHVIMKSPVNAFKETGIQLEEHSGNYTVVATVHNLNQTKICNSMFPVSIKELFAFRLCSRHLNAFLKTLCSVCVLLGCFLRNP